MKLFDHLHHPSLFQHWLDTTLVSTVIKERHLRHTVITVHPFRIISHFAYLVSDAGSYVLSFSHVSLLTFFYLEMLHTTRGRDQLRVGAHSLTQSNPKCSTTCRLQVDNYPATYQ